MPLNFFLIFFFGDVFDFIVVSVMNKWDPWEEIIQKSRNPRMLQQLTLHSQQIIKATSTQDLDPRPLPNHVVPSAIGSLFLFGRFGFPPLSLCQFRH